MRPVVGIDPSLTATGVCGAGLPFTVPTSPTGSAIAERLGRIQGIAGHIANSTPWAALVVIEGPSFGPQNRAGQAHLRAGLWWHIAATMTARACDLVEVPPATLKKFATGKGNATKADMRMALYKRAELDIADDNQVDAWWLLQVGLHLLENPMAIALPKDQLAVISPLLRQLPAT